MLFKKNVAASDSPCAIRVARARPFGYQIPSSGVALEAAHHFFSGGVARVCGGGMIGLQQAFFSPLSFLSLDLEIHVNPSKNTIVSSNLYFYHYQKIDKYKRKYRGNIFIGKFSRDFTDRNIPSVYTERITVGKKLKQSKKNDDMSFLPTELPTEFIPSVNLLVNCEHCSSC